MQEVDEDELWSLYSTTNNISRVTSAENPEEKTTLNDAGDEQKAQDSGLSAFMKKCSQLYKDELKKMEEKLCQQITDCFNEEKQTEFRTQRKDADLAEKCKSAELTIQKLRTKLANAEAMLAQQQNLSKIMNDFVWNALSMKMPTHNCQGNLLDGSKIKADQLFNNFSAPFGLPSAPSSNTSVLHNYTSNINSSSSSNNSSNKFGQTNSALAQPNFAVHNVVSQAPSSNLPAPAQPKNWHASVTQQWRDQMAGSLVKSIYPEPNIHDKRFEDLKNYARKVEKEIFEQAANQSVYFKLLADKIFMIQKELQEKRSHASMN